MEKQAMKEISAEIESLRIGKGLILAEHLSTLQMLMDSGSSKAYFCAHVGSSMNPTLHESDMLEIARYGQQSPRLGDVILFVSQKGERPVVHRVVGVTKLGIRTRGDNNSYDDPWLVKRDDVIGRVVAAWGGNRRRKIPGSIYGRLLAHILRVRLAADRIVSSFLRPCYVFLSRHGVVRHVLPYHLRPKLVVFPAKEQRQVRLIFGGRTVGYLEFGCWHIKRPYRLLVDLPTLPTFQASDQAVTQLAGLPKNE
jgi:signal peptidase I